MKLSEDNNSSNKQPELYNISRAGYIPGHGINAGEVSAASLASVASMASVASAPADIRTLHTLNSTGWENLPPWS